MDINLEELIGRKVLTLNDHYIGRLEEVRADLRDGRCFIEEYLVGKYAVLDRLSALSIARPLLGMTGTRTGYRIPWDKLDLSDPKKPKLKCKVTQLKRI